MVRRHRARAGSRADRQGQRPPGAPTIPESVFFLFQLSFAVISFAIVLGATAERMRLGATALFAALWCALVYAPIAHWVWHPTGWLAKMGHMDFAGGTVVHVAAGATGLAAALVVGPRAGFGKQPMVPHNLLTTVLGAGLLWAGWFGFNAGSAFEASARAAGALLATQLAACTGALAWGAVEYMRRGQWSVLGMMTGAIAGLIAVTRRRASSARAVRWPSARCRGWRASWRSPGSRP
jgi:Amt family ammonium transporter